MGRRTSPPSPEEAERALYIDFEGTAVDPPSLLGVLWSQGGRQHFVQYVVEEALWPAAAPASGRPPNTECQATDLPGALRDLRDLADRDGRRIFSWSNRELEAIRADSGDDELAEWYADKLTNAIPLARRWRKRFHPQSSLFNNRDMGGREILARYFTLIGYRVPPALGPGLVAERIRQVREMLQRRGGEYEALTPTVKAKWTKALRHNYHDCNGLRDLILTVANDLAAR